MKETLSSILLVGFVIATPLAIALTIVAGSETGSFAVGVDEREYVPYYEEESYLEYE